MRLDELIMVSHSQPSVIMTDKEVAEVEAFLADAQALQLPHQLEVREKSDSLYRWIGIFKRSKLFGWIKLKPIKVRNERMHSIELIYILPEYRRSAAAGWLFLYAKDLVGSPIVLGDESSYGGVAFKDGEDLLKALQKTGKFDMSLLDLKTGEKLPLEFPLKDDRFTTVLIESLVDLQLIERLAESHAPPLAEPHDSYHVKIDWLEDVEDEAQ